MRILLVNKYYFLKGGAERHFFALKEELQKNGHDVVVFSMQHPKNEPSPYAEYFVSQTDFSQVRFSWNGVRAASRMFWSFEAARKLAALIRATKPDIAHVHNIYHQLSPSILPVLKKHNVPVVMTVHDFNVISPSYNLFHDGTICEKCKPDRYYEAILHRCVKHSLTASTIAAAAQYLHRWMRVYQKNVSAIISPSRFALGTFHAWNTSFKHEYVLNNFVEHNDNADPTPGTYFLFMGRLSQEKGVDVLLDAAAKSHHPIVIAGTGPQEQDLRKIATDRNLSHVQFVGFQTGDALQQLVKNCRAMVVPSQCYEVGPLVVLEAFAAGKPVVATRLGGTTELVQDGVNGLLVDAGANDQFAGAMDRLATDDTLVRTLGEHALQSARQYNPESYYDALMKIYGTIRTA